MAFRNEVTAGNTLIREAIQSQGYDPGTDGWIIRADGSAEFNDVVIRGGTVVSGTALYYDGAPGPGTLMMSIAAEEGTDPFGNAYPAGLTLFDPDGSEVQLFSGNGASLYVTPQTLAGVVWASAKLTTTIGASSRPGLSVSSPAATSGGIGGGTASVVLFGEGPTTTDTSVLVAADRVNISGRLDVTGDLTAGSQASGTAQTPAPGASPAQTSVAVSFGKTFSAVPRVLLTPNSGSADLNNANIRYAVTGKTTTGCTINCWRDTNAATNFEWFATL